MPPLYDALVAVTADPLWVTVAFQALPTLVSPGNVKASFQPLTAAVPVLVTVTLATRPPCHSCLLYVTRQLPVELGVGVPLRVALGVGDVVRLGDALAVLPVPLWSCTTTIEYA